MAKSSEFSDPPFLKIKTNLDIPLTVKVTRQIYNLIVSGNASQADIRAQKGSLQATFVVYFFLPMEAVLLGKIYERLFTYFSKILWDETRKGRALPPSIEIEYVRPDGEKMTIKLTGEVGEFENVVSFLEKSRLK
jgi:hypothetical protein